LNFKNIDYNTEWVEYPDLAPTFKALGIPPGSDDPPYTSPAIQFDDGTFAMGSLEIAHELEKRYPSPSLHLDDPIVANFKLAKFQKPLVPHVVPKVPEVLLNQRSAEYFYRTREERYSMPLPQYANENATEERWEEAREGIEEVADLLKKNGGPYFLGETGKP
jgi:glutathione S-transferase